MPKNFTNEQIIAHLVAQTESRNAGTYSGQAAQLNQFMQNLEQYAGTLPAGSDEERGIMRLRNSLSTFLMNLTSMARAHEYGETRRMNELMTRCLSNYESFQSLYSEMKENYPQAFQRQELASFDQDFENAVFSEGGDILDDLEMSDKKYVAPEVPIDLANMSLDYLGISEPRVGHLENWLREMNEKTGELINAPTPNYLDPDRSVTQYYNHVVRQVGADYYRNAARGIFTNAIAQLPDAELRSIFRQLKTPQGKKFMTEDYFISRLKAGTLGVMFSKDAWGTTDEKIMSVLTQALENKPELQSQIISSLKQIKVPTDPNYPLGKIEQVDAAEIAELRTLWTEPEDVQLINEASEIMTNFNDTVREYIDSFALGPTTLHGGGLDKIMDRLSERFTQQGMKAMAGGKYEAYMRPWVENAETGHLRYDIITDHPQLRPQGQMPEEIKEELRNAPNTLSPLTVETVTKAADILDSMSFEGTKYTTLSDSLPYQARKADAPYEWHDSEEDEKYYSFMPLMKAKFQVHDAIIAQDKEALKNAVAAYKAEEAKADALMALLKTEGLNKEPLFSGNVNATRHLARSLPAKYMADYTGHNTANSLYNLYAPLKTFGLTVQEFMQNPVGTMEKMQKMFAEANDLDSHAENTGSAFSWMRQNYASDYIRIWDVLSEQLTRGTMGIAALEPDPAKRDEFIAKLRLAQLTAHYPAERDLDLITEIEKTLKGESVDADEKRNLLYQHAALLPDSGENRFNMKKFAEKLVDDPNWRQSLSLEGQLTPEAIAQMDLSALAQRPQKILQDFDEACIRNHTYATNFSKDDFLINTFALYSRILKDAPANMRQTPGYQALKDTVAAIPDMIAAPKQKELLQAASFLSDTEDPFNYFQTRKTELFNKSDNTPEYDRMKTSVDAVRAAIGGVRNLGTQNATSLAGLVSPRLEEKLKTASEDTFNYMRLKTKNGTKTSFSNRSGQLRYDEADTTLQKIFELQDQLGLRSPAQKVYDETRLEFLKNRSNKKWMKDNAMYMTTKMIYAKQIIDSKIPAALQEKNNLFEEQTMDNRIKSMMRSQPIRSYVILTDNGQLAKQALEGTGKFREIAEQYTSRRVAEYKKITDAAAVKDAAKKRTDQIEGFKQGYALDLACDKLGYIRANDPRTNANNPQVKALAEQIKKDPEFKEVMDRVMKDIPPQNLSAKHALNVPLAEANKRCPDYYRQLSAIQYEKKYAEKVATLFINKEGLKKISVNPVDMIRKDPKFKEMMETQLDGKKPEDIQKMIRDLDRPDAVDRVRQAMMQSVQQPQVPQQPQANQVNNNQPQVNQAGNQDLQGPGMQAQQ